MSPWEITFEAVRGDAVCVQSHSSPIFVNQTRPHNASQTKNTQCGFLATRHELDSRSPGQCVWFSLICSLSQEPADLYIVAIDNLPEAVVGWRRYTRRHKAGAYIYSVTQKRSSSPWTTGTTQFKFKVTHVVMFHHPWIPLLSRLHAFLIRQTAELSIASSAGLCKPNFTRFGREPICNQWFAIDFKVFIWGLQTFQSE
jgi:hypothetical protein